MSKEARRGQGHTGFVWLWIPVRRCGYDQSLSLARSWKAEGTSQAAGNSGWMGPPIKELRLGGSLKNRDRSKDGRLRNKLLLLPTLKNPERPKLLKVSLCPTIF